MKKLENKKGFTLAELLIVVAIIAVLVAVSIPIFTAQLEKSRESTDIANLRAAKAAAVTKVLDGSLGTKTLTYDASNGVLTETYSGSGYGKGTETTGSEDNTFVFGNFTYNPGKGYEDAVITIIPDSTAEAGFRIEFSK